MWTNVRSERRGVRLAALLLALLAPAVAHAQGAPDAGAPSAGGDEAPAAGDPLDALRGRFRDGMEKYRARAFGDAIVIWESIYRELGAEKGYRVAFDLGRAYDEIGELIKAAEHYQTYLERVAARRAAGESLETNVQAQETIAQDRLERIIHIYGGIRVASARRPVIVHLDNEPPRVAGFTAYVEPGPHTVTFGSGASADVRRLVVRRGELLEVAPKEEAPAAELRFETHVEHPFSPTFLWVGAGVAALSVLVPVVTHANALSIKSDYDAASATNDDKRRLATEYDSARSNAYATIVIPAVLTAAVGGLTIWYLAGRKEIRTPLPAAAIGPNGGTVGLTGRF